MKTAAHEPLETLLDQDIDNLSAIAVRLPEPSRIELIRSLISELPKIDEPGKRLRAFRLLQAILAALANDHLPADLAADIVALVGTMPLEDEARRAAYDILALVALKAGQLTSAVSAAIYALFAGGVSDTDPAIRGFARAALEGQGVLSSRLKPSPTAEESESTSCMDAGFHRLARLPKR